MAVTQNTYTGDGSTTQFAFTFPYLDKTDVQVKLNSVTQAITAYSFANATTIQMTVAPAANDKIIIYRNTRNDNKQSTFYAGSAIKAEDLNNNFDQILYVAQEVDNNAMSTLGDTAMQGDMLCGGGFGVSFEGVTDDSYETRLMAADPTADRTITLPNHTGNIVLTGLADQITATELSANCVDSSELVDGSVDLVHMSANSVDSDQYVDGSIDTAHIAAGAVSESSLGNNAITTVKIADQAVTAAKIANSTITSNQIASGTILAANIDNNTITSNQIAAGTITSTEIGNGQIINSTLGSNAVTTAKIADDAVQTAKIENDAITSAKIAANAVQTAKIADSAVTTAKIADDAVTTAKIADAELKVLAGMNSATASILSDGSVLNSVINEIDGICDGMQKEFAITDDHAKYPTSAAVVSYVAAQLLPFGGFEAIDNEDSFPATNPAAGVIISIADVTGITVDSSGVSDTCRQVGSGSDDVRITDFPTTLRGGNGDNADPYPLPDTTGLLVVATGTVVSGKDVYKYHRLLPTTDDVKQLTDDVNSFFDRYRIASSAPGSNNNAGDLYYDTSANRMKVYNNATSEWDDVAQSSSSHIVTLTEAFDGSRTEFEMSTAATDAQSTIVSINGVIQKPNAGTDAPSEGFAIHGDTLKLSSAPATGSDYFVVVLGDTVSIGTPSDNTVTAAILQSGCVTTAKIAADAVDGTKIADNAIDTAHIAADAITGAKIADDAVGSEHIETLDDNLVLLKPTGTASIKIGSGNAAGAQLFLDGDSNGDVSGSDYSYIEHNADGDVVIGCDNPAHDANCFIKVGQADEYQARFNAGGSAELRYANSKKFETTSGGIEITGTTATQKLTATNTYSATGTTQVGYQVHNESDTTDTYAALRLTAGTTSPATAQISSVRKGAGSNDITFQLESNNTAKEMMRMASDGVITCATGTRFDMLGNAKIVDDAILYVGTHNDLQIYHDGDNSYIEDTGTGSLYLKTDSHIYMLDGSDNTMLEAVAGGAIKLRYSNDPKFETTSTGIKVTGTINETGQEHDIWRLSSSLSSSDSTITTNLERDDTLSFSIPGTGMTQSSGVFTFPSTGYWEVTFISTVWDTDAVKYAQVAIQQTNDNANYVEVSKGLGNMHADVSDDVVYVNVIAKQIVDVTSTANVKVKFRVTSHATLNWNGSSSVNMTYMMFKRLGDT